MSTFTEAKTAIINLRLPIDSWEGGKGRYLLVEVEYGGKKRIFLRGMDLVEHRDVFGALMGEIADRGAMSVNCLGGGHFRLSPDKKLVLLDDSSITFGMERERDIRTVELFREALPDYRATTDGREFYDEW